MKHSRNSTSRLNFLSAFIAFNSKANTVTKYTANLASNNNVYNADKAVANIDNILVENARRETVRPVTLVTSNATFFLSGHHKRVYLGQNLHAASVVAAVSVFSAKQSLNTDTVLVNSYAITKHVTVRKGNTIAHVPTWALTFRNFNATAVRFFRTAREASIEARVTTRRNIKNASDVMNLP